MPREAHEGVGTLDEARSLERVKGFGDRDGAAYLVDDLADSPGMRALKQNVEDDPFDPASRATMERIGHETRMSAGESAPVP